ncbi:hypothetical protein PHMEG_00025022, partial [Phytophthora megakarya]
MASEWNGIMGGSHASIDPSSMKEELSRFYTMPSSKKLVQTEKEALVKPILEDEVLLAICQLSRDKSGGTTGLSHDFFKDFQDEMRYKGAAVPETFLDAVVVPLRKKGYSQNAMDYRPISLLNTAYMIFGR